MESEIILKVGKKGAIYLPKKVMEMLGINEGDKVKVKIQGNKLTLEFIPDPLALALKLKKWAKTTVEEFEKESEELQRGLYND
ncbi:MAG: AbrB/MazE/SpoVT family DNA-binding domain-containing protein [Candidatus Njordarchaeales archaeon]